MSLIKNRIVQDGVRESGKVLSSLFKELDVDSFIGKTTFDLDSFIEKVLAKKQLISQAYGYHGYPRYSCISVNDVVVHGIPSKDVFLKSGDIVTIDICASHRGFCADMARTYILGKINSEDQVYKKKNDLIVCAQEALDCAINVACVNNFLGDIGYAVESHVVNHGYGLVRDFSGHGIGRSMHEEPRVPNYGNPGKGIKLRHGMILAIEPMITIGSGAIKIDKDGWTARSKEGGLTAHVEDTVILTDAGPEAVTR